MSPVVVLLFSLFILHTRVTSQSVDPLNLVERNALLDFITKVKHSPRLNWNASEPACSWRGVTCNPTNTAVLYLRFPSSQLIGEIPPNTIGKLTSLRVLSLHHNNLNGTIPSDFSDLTSLTVLYLHNNSFSGKLPNIKAHLTSFNVSHNKLNSSIPSTLSMFPESAFSANVFLCGEPLPPCSSSYQDPCVTDSLSRCGTIELDESPTDKGKIVGISLGSAQLLLILFCSVGKKMYQKIKPPSSTASEMERNKPVLSGDGVDSFDLEDLLKTSAEVLGEGSVGTSYKLVLVEKKTTVVVKILKDVAVTEEEFKSAMEGLRKMKNKNVVPLRGFHDHSKHEKLLVYDYMPAGSLSAHLHGSIGSVRTQLDWDHRMRIALSAANGLAYLHVVGEVIHGNIKSSNIFLQQQTNNEASLSDYGLNTLFRESSFLNHRVTGYWAPEVLETREFTFESDVYSFGVLLLELLTGKNPNQASLDKEGVHFSKWVGSIVCEEPKAELFDVELTRDHNIDKMVQMLRIAKDCVSIVPNQRPPIHNVVSMMEDVLLRQSSDYHSKGYIEYYHTRHTANPYDLM